MDWPSKGLRDGVYLRPIFLFLLSHAALFGQAFSVGVKGGLRTTDDYEPVAESQSRRYVVGPMLNIALPRGFGIEFDALYRRSGYTAAWGTSLYNSTIREATNVWEFPLLVRYRLPIHVVRPYVEAGWAPRIGHGSQISSGSYLSSPTTYIQYYNKEKTNWPTTHGVVAGGGIAIPAGRLELSPGLRYTHWNREAVRGQFADGGSYASRQDQLDFLVGISFRVAK
jgi:hypothetical protein